MRKKGTGKLLSGKQKKHLDMNKDGRLTKLDFLLLRKKKKRGKR